MPTPHQLNYIRQGGGPLWPQYHQLEPVESLPKLPLNSLAAVHDALKIGTPDKDERVYKIHDTPDFVIRELAAAIISNVPDFEPDEENAVLSRKLMGLFNAIKLRSALQVKLIQVMRLPAEEQPYNPADWAVFYQLQAQKEKMFALWVTVVDSMNDQQIELAREGVRFLGCKWKYHSVV
jgi:hypothetical protein